MDGKEDWDKCPQQRFDEGKLMDFYCGSTSKGMNFLLHCNSIINKMLGLIKKIQAEKEE